MKRSIDLTDNHDFRDVAVAPLTTINNKKYPTSRFPWKDPNDDIEDINGFSYLNNYYDVFYDLSSSTSFTYTDVALNDLSLQNNINRLVGLNRTYRNISYTRTSIQSLDIYLDNDALDYLHFQYDLKNYAIYRDTIDEYLDKHKRTKGGLPVGKKRELIESYRDIARENASKKMLVKKTAKKFDRFNHICFIETNKSDITDCNLDDFAMAISVPCLSSSMTINTNRIYKSHNTICYSFYDAYKDKKDYRQYSVYSKNPMRTNRSPWQPNGRKRQPYDELFDKLNWRDMLRKRLYIIETADMND